MYQPLERGQKKHKFVHHFFIFLPKYLNQKQKKKLVKKYLKKIKKSVDNNHQNMLE